jgi:hypothetical protein
MARTRNTSLYFSAGEKMLKINESVSSPSLAIHTVGDKRHLCRRKPTRVFYLSHHQLRCNLRVYKQLSEAAGLAG